MTDTPDISLIPQRYEGDADLTALVDWPGNPRDHAEEAIRVAGHGRRDELVDAGITAAPVIWLDCDEQTAARLVAALNATEDQAGYHADLLAEFLAGLAEHDADLRGTGYEPSALDDLLADLADADADAYRPAELGEATIAPTPSERQEGYEAAGVRSVVLPFPLEAYERVVTRLQELRFAHDLESNAEVVEKLVMDAEVPERA